MVSKKAHKPDTSNPYRKNVTMRKTVLAMVDEFKDTELASVMGMDSRSAFFETLAVAFFIKLHGKEKEFATLTTLDPSDLTRYRPEVEKLRKQLEHDHDQQHQSNPKASSVISRT